MPKKFKVLRIIGTIWKILAWISLIVGTLSSIGILLTGIFGRGLASQIGRRPGPWGPLVFSAAGGIAGFIAALIVTVIYFLALYAIGDMIYLVLAIEENTRLTVQWMQYQAQPAPQTYQSPQPAPAPPPPPVNNSLMSTPPPPPASDA